MTKVKQKDDGTAKHLAATDLKKGEHFTFEDIDNDNHLHSSLKENSCNAPATTTSFCQTPTSLVPLKSIRKYIEFVGIFRSVQT